MMGALKLGAAGGLGYTFGGKAGLAILKAVQPEASPEAITGAVWGGRIALGLGLMFVFSRL